ncbi:hypothetical protein IGI37_003330 [Enterococcus sp. AZ194]|uniref:TetR/AcrR family transcriptional regulator n=1 Tax=Enterococcus sp. AZ194 TaxID=2774629 RepID=UPI003F220647
MNKQRFTSEIILKEAYQLAVQEGISQVTVRKLAHRVGMSTQPIYYTFKNIEQIREIAIEQIFIQIKAHYFKESSSLGGYINDLGTFFYEESALYLSLITDRLTYTPTQQFLYQTFCQSVKELELTNEKKQLMCGHIVGVFTSYFILENVNRKSERESWLNSMQQQVRQMYLSEEENKKENGLK